MSYEQRIWHVISDHHEQVGPLTSSEVRDCYAGGSLNGRIYAWRDGFADWLPIGNIAGFEDLIPRVDPERARAAEISSLFDTLNQMAGGDAWLETAETLGDYLEHNAALEVGENTGMLDILALQKRYKEVGATRQPSDPYVELAVGTGEMPIVAAAVRLPAPEPEATGLIKTLIAAGMALAITTVTIALLMVVG